MWIEDVFLRSNNNPEATKRILATVEESKSEAIFMLGDLVALGHNKRGWGTIDRFLEAMKKKGRPVFAILGNHELMGKPLKGEANFQERFPDHVKTGYVRIVDSIAVMMMNSNFSLLSIEEFRMQSDWYKKKLIELDDDDAIRAIIVCCHHSPFTNSRLVRPSKNVQDEFIPAYLQSKKAALFLSGHAHIFEHYKIKGKDFLVIGGGGGLRHPRSRSSILQPDHAAGHKPVFHYLTVIRKHGILEAVSHALQPDFDGFDPHYRVTVEVGKK
jgi:predicted MPP superfamily phosphohydrolase